jgi:hypothetical protein
MHRVRLSVVVAIAMVALSHGRSLAQPAPALTYGELSKEADNPLSYLITLPLRYEAGFDQGPYNAVKSTFELDQALVPVRLGDDWDLITRTKLPFESVPPKDLGKSWETGLSSGYTTFFLSPRHGDGFFWGAGPVLYYPTATNKDVGINKWGIGPSVAFVNKDSSPWEWGFVANNIWSLGGPPHSKNRTNSLLLNPIISYHFADGWSIGSSPEIEADWLSQPGQQWTVPIGTSISKTFRLGGQAVRLAFGSYFNAIRPQASNDTWVSMLTLTFLFST